MSTALYVFQEVDAKTARPSTVLAEIRKIFVEDKTNENWAQVEQYLRPPGRCGSRQFDQCMAVQKLLEADRNANGYISEYMATHNATERDVWNLLQRVVRASGFTMSHGRLIGIKETHESIEFDENGQPDID